jgi:hypothetical protein
MRLARLVLVASVSVACTPRGSESVVSEQSPSEPSESEPFVEAEPRSDTRELGPRLGGRVTARSPALGRWAASFEFDQHRFVTMEFTVESRQTGSIVLHLEPEGRMRLCVHVREHSGSAMSRYQSHDGKDHRTSDDHETKVGMLGRWSTREGSPDIDIVIERMRWDGCAVDPSTPVFEQPPLRCFAFAANDAVPRDALLCELPETFHALLGAALLIGDSPRVGAWNQRIDPSGHGEQLPANAKPHLLLGADPGVAITTVDHDRDAEPLTIHAAAVGDFQSGE